MGIETRKKDLVKKGVLTLLAVLFVCVLVGPVLTACGGPKYLGQYLLQFPGVATDVTAAYEGTTLVINETNREITLEFPEGGPQVFEYESGYEDSFYIDGLNDDETLATTILVLRVDTMLEVHFTQLDLEDRTVTTFIMEFEPAGDDQYLVSSVSEISGTGFLSLGLMAKGAIDVMISIDEPLSFTRFLGSYNVKGNSITVYDDENTLVFVGTLVDNHIIQINLTNNTGFAAMLSGTGDVAVGSIVTMSRLGCC